MLPDGISRCSTARSSCARITSDPAGTGVVLSAAPSRTSSRHRAGLDAIFRAILVIALVLQLAILLTGIVSRFWFDQIAAMGR